MKNPCAFRGLTSTSFLSDSYRISIYNRCNETSYLKVRYAKELIGEIIKERNHCTLLISACKENNMRTIHYLLEKYKYTNPKNSEPVKWAMVHKDKYLIRLLLKYGFKLDNVRPFDGRVVMFYNHMFVDQKLTQKNIDMLRNEIEAEIALENL